MSESAELQLVIDLNQQIQHLLSKEDWVGVIKCLRDEHHLMEISWELLWSLGWAYSKLDKFKDAEKYLLKATLIAPDNHICHWTLGTIYFDLKQYKKAEFSLLEALRILDGALPRLILSMVYVKQGRLDEAEEVHLEGLRLKPNSQKRYEAYSDFLLDRGREKEAQEMYQRAEAVGGLCEVVGEE